MQDSGVSLRQIRESFFILLESVYDKKEIASIFSMLAEEYLGLSRALMLLSLDQELPENTLKRFKEALNDLAGFRPVQYILGKTEFCGLLFYVSEGVLIPRPETEELVDWVTANHGNSEKGIRLLDIGTGSGCIAIALKKLIPWAEVSGLDISSHALDIAARNAFAHDVDVSLRFGDIFRPMTWEGLGMFDVMVSNPPYVCMSEKHFMKPNVLNFEPHEALFVDDNDPLVFYRYILEFAKDHLGPGGNIFVEINQAKGKELIRLVREMQFTLHEIKKDISGNDRMAKITRD